MKIARFVLKIVALSLAAAAAVCAVIAYWDKLSELGDCAKVKLQQRACSSEYDDYEEYDTPSLQPWNFHGCFFLPKQDSQQQAPCQCAQDVNRSKPRSGGVSASVDTCQQF